ncbi:MAG: peptidylprolyl isomerase [Dehalococcoidia bacterium]|nr:peptidylprolyl isomerase [Dehalococcoidia bacterium]
MRRLLSPATLAAVALTATLAWTACGSDNSDKIVVKSGGGTQIRATPFATVPAPEGPIPTRTADFASLCLKTNQRQWSSMPPMIIDPNLSYSATIRTEKGDIIIKLLPDIAPYTVNNFVFLACSGFYDGLTFFRVAQKPLPEGIPHPFAQAGDPSERGFYDPVRGGPGYFIPEELSDRKFLAGTVGMSSGGRGTPVSGSQFFIVFEEAPELDGQYTIFGEVTSGLDVLESLTPHNPQRDATPGDKILEIVIQEGQ